MKSVMQGMLAVLAVLTACGVAAILGIEGLPRTYRAVAVRFCPPIPRDVALEPPHLQWFGPKADFGGRCEYALIDEQTRVFVTLSETYSNGPTRWKVKSESSYNTNSYADFVPAAVAASKLGAEVYR